MELKDYEELKKKLCKHLEDIANHKSYDMGDIEAIDKLVHAIEKIGKIVERDFGGYSARGGMWSADGIYGRNDMMYPYSHDNGMMGNNPNGSSYGREGTHYVRGHYSRTDEMEGSLRQMMNDPNTSSSDRAILEKALEIARR